MINFLLCCIFVLLGKEKRGHAVEGFKKFSIEGKNSEGGVCFLTKKKENFFKCQTLDEKILIPSVLPRFHYLNYLKYVHVSKQVFISRLYKNVTGKNYTITFPPVEKKMFFFFFPLYKFFFDSNFASSKDKIISRFYINNF